MGAIKTAVATASLVGMGFAGYMAGESINDVTAEEIASRQAEVAELQSEYIAFAGGRACEETVLATLLTVDYDFYRVPNSESDTKEALDGACQPNDEGQGHQQLAYDASDFFSQVDGAQSKLKQAEDNSEYGLEDKIIAVGFPFGVATLAGFALAGVMELRKRREITKEARRMSRV